MSTSVRSVLGVILRVSAALFFLAVLYVLGQRALLYVDESYVGGYLAARRDIAHGHLIILESGFISNGSVEAARVIKARYGVETHFTGCVITEDGRAFRKGYNTVSEAAIEKRFGKGFIERAYAEAERQQFSQPEATH